MRLIDADNAYKVLTDYYNQRTENQHKALKEAIEAVPTVDAEPTRHGHWEWNDYGGFGNYHCTVCRYIPYGKFSRKFRPDYMYCPRCGAKMDEGEQA